MLQLFGDVFPVVCVRQRRLRPGNRWPHAGKFEIERGELDFVGIEIFFSLNGVDRALGNADSTVNAFVWINHQKIGAFTKAVNWANINTVGIFATDAGFGNNVGHGL